MNHRYRIVCAATLLACGLIGCNSLTMADSNSAGEPKQTETSQVNYDKPGFVTHVDSKDGRLWVLRESEQTSNRYVSLVGAGPGGITIKALERETAIEYIATRPGFVTRVDRKDGRLWVLREGEEPSGRHVARVNAGPMGLTIKALEAQTIDDYLAAGQ